jgi:hypothetical protein
MYGRNAYHTPEPSRASNPISPRKTELIAAIADGRAGQRVTHAFLRMGRLRNNRTSAAVRRTGGEGKSQARREEKIR